MAATLLSTRPKNGEDGGSCVAYAGAKCFGKLFGANLAKEIYTNTVTNVNTKLIYAKSPTMMTTPCCIVWSNGNAGHVGVIESSTGTGNSKRYTFSDSNRSPEDSNKVSVLTNQTEDQIKALLTPFSGYVQFD